MDGAVILRAGGEVQAATVAAALERRPVIACETGHESSPAAAVDAALATAAAQLFRARTPWLRTERCADCSTRLALPVRRTRRALTVVTDGVPVHTLHLDVPMTRCGECGLDQVPGRSQHDVDAAVRAAYLASSDGTAPTR